MDGRAEVAWGILAIGRQSGINFPGARKVHGEARTQRRPTRAAVARDGGERGFHLSVT